MLKVKNRKSEKAQKGKNRFVIFVGDEGAILVYSCGKKVLRRLYSPVCDVDSTVAFDEIIRSDPKAPISMLVDMMDQSYIKQTLPPVTKMSVQKLIKRRLERDFSPEDITGAIALGREEGGRKDWNYLLVALAKSAQLSAWLDFILAFENRFMGIHLVPVEARNIMQALGKSLLKESNSHWQLMVSHNKVGGFRQVIIKDGKLVFTRITQPIGDTMPDVVAGNIEQEITNTIEYLRRLSYDETGGLDTYIIVSEEIKKSIDPARIKAQNIVLLNPYEVAEALQLENAALPEDHYADVVSSAFFAMYAKPVLTLFDKQGKRLKNYYDGILAIQGGAALCLAFLVIFSIYSILRITTINQEIEITQQNIGKMRRILQEANDDAQLLPADMNQIIDVVSIYTRYSEKGAVPLTFIRHLQEVLEKNILVRSLVWKNEKPLEMRNKNGNEALIIQVDIEFLPDGRPIEKMNAYAQEFAKKLQVAFPTYEVTHGELPGGLRNNETFQANFDPEKSRRSGKAMGSEAMIAKFTFKGYDPVASGADIKAIPEVQKP